MLDFLLLFVFDMIGLYENVALYIFEFLFNKSKYSLKSAVKGVSVKFLVLIEWNCSVVIGKRVIVGGANRKREKKKYRDV